jgi:hypothetical protein
VGYALGRTVLASDKPLIEEMTKEGADVTFAKLATEIVTSKQFRYRREPAEPATPPPASKSEVKQSAKRSLPLKKSSSSSNKEGGL